MEQSTAAPAFLAEGERVYAIGDIHGCADKLEIVHNKIVDDMREYPIENVTLVHLGDYIDRGPDSAAVLDRIVNPISELARLQTINLMGNHEAMLLDAFAGKRGAFDLWTSNGGEACLRSWGAPAQRWKRHVPPEHLQAIRDLSLMHIQGGYVFVHAGIRPDVNLRDQIEDDLRWIREPFLDYEGTFSHVVVHGHTPEDLEPVIRHNRIGIDTGAVFGGPLTCIVLEEHRMRFLFS